MEFCSAYIHIQNGFAKPERRMYRLFSFPEPAKNSSFYRFLMSATAPALVKVRASVLGTSVSVLDLTMMDLSRGADAAIASLSPLLKPAEDARFGASSSRAWAGPVVAYGGAEFPLSQHKIWQARSGRSRNIPVC
jgi:hypothetical protein